MENKYNERELPNFPLNPKYQDHNPLCKYNLVPKKHGLERSLFTEDTQIKFKLQSSRKWLEIGSSYARNFFTVECTEKVIRKQSYLINTKSKVINLVKAFVVILLRNIIYLLNWNQTFLL